MENKMITVCKLVVMSCLSLALMNCATNDYDSISVHDKRGYHYSAKVLIPTRYKQLDIIVEHQGSQGDSTVENPAVTKLTAVNTDSTPSVTATEIHPAITTQNSFKASADSVGFKWNFVNQSHFGMNLYFSVMHLDTSIDIDIPAYLTNAPSKQHFDLVDTMFVPKFEVYVPITERLRVAGSISYAGLLDDESLNTASLDVDYLLTKNLSLGLGARHWEYSSTQDRDYESSLVNDKLNFSTKSDIYLRSNGILGEVTYRF